MTASERSESTATVTLTTPTHSSARSGGQSAATSVLFAKDRCLFCDRGKQFRKGAVDDMVQCLTTEAAETILLVAKQNNDFELLGKQGRRLCVFKVFIEYPLNFGSCCISMFSLNLTFDKTLIKQFCYVFLKKSPLFGI